MARLIPNNKLTKALIQAKPNQTTQDIIFIAGKLMRLKILLDRENRGFSKADVNGPKDAFETSGLSIYETGKLEREKLHREAKGDRGQLETVPAEAYTSQVYKKKNSNIVKDYIAIIDLDFSDDDKAIRGYDRIVLPFVPRELSYEPSSKFVGIATMGRNTPFYQFTGSEDTLKFEIDWYALEEKDQDRKNVINSCRWVEALSKSNGYKDLPHRVKLLWGQDDLLWQDDIWIVVDAPYTLSEFKNGYTKDDLYTSIGKMPQQATQSITLKRVMGSNRNTREIIGPLKR